MWLCGVTLECAACELSGDRVVCSFGDPKCPSSVLQGQSCTWRSEMWLVLRLCGQCGMCTLELLKVSVLCGKLESWASTVEYGWRNAGVLQWNVCCGSSVLSLCSMDRVHPRLSLWSLSFVAQERSE